MNARLNDRRFVLRPAVMTDAAAITDVWYEGWREAHLGYVPDALLAHRSPRQFRDRVPAVLPATTVATVDDQPVGLVVTADDEIEQLYVAGAYRGTGVAAALLRHGETMIARRYSAAFLAVVAGNTRARRFYERQGWRDAGPFDYHAWASAGDRIAVPCLRFEKTPLTPAPGT